MSETIVNEKTLAALQQAARFVLEYAGDIDHNSAFAAEHIRVEHPHATFDAVLQTYRGSDELRKTLDEVLKALSDAGIDD